MDCVELDTFHEIQAKLSSQVIYKTLDFYELPEARLGVFDFVFCLGILYHLKHPLLALEIVCGLTTDTAIVESFVINADDWEQHQNEVPKMEFYETDELGNQLDNWIGPSVSCLMAMCRAAGFARVKLLYATGFNAGVACFRKWEPTQTHPALIAPKLIAVMNTRTSGFNFSTRKEEYISCWFESEQPAISREQLRIEVGGFGIPALFVKCEESGAWMANCRLPPGLNSGWNTVRLRLACSAFGEKELRIAVDMPVVAKNLRVKDVCDGATWSRSEIKLSEQGGFITCWLEGLPENADRSNVTIRIGTSKLLINYIAGPDAAGSRQVNAQVVGKVHKGVHNLEVKVGDTSACPFPITVC